MATPYFLRKTALGRTLCRQVHPPRTCRRKAYVVKLLIQASSQAEVGGGVLSVLSFLSLAWCSLLYFCGQFVIFRISHKSERQKLVRSAFSSIDELSTGPCLRSASRIAQGCVLPVVRCFRRDHHDNGLGRTNAKQRGDPARKSTRRRKGRGLRRCGADLQTSPGACS